MSHKYPGHCMLLLYGKDSCCVLIHILSIQNSIKISIGYFSNIENRYSKDNCLVYFFPDRVQSADRCTLYPY